MGHRLEVNGLEFGLLLQLFVLLDFSDVTECHHCQVALRPQQGRLDVNFSFVVNDFVKVLQTLLGISEALKLASILLVLYQVLDDVLHFSDLSAHWSDNYRPPFVLVGLLLNQALILARKRCEIWLDVSSEDVF